MHCNDKGYVDSPEKYEYRTLLQTPMIGERVLQYLISPIAETVALYTSVSSSVIVMLFR